MLKEDYPRLRERVEAALEAREAAALGEAAHAIKGVVKNFYALSAARAAEELERCGRQADFAGAEPAWRALQREVERLVSALELTIADQAAGVTKGGP